MTTTSSHPPIGPAADAPNHESVEAAPRPKRLGKRHVFAGVLGLAIAVGALYWHAHRYIQSTDDAQIDADVVALAPRTSGVVAKVAVSDNEEVKSGQVLAELDDAPARAKLAQADAMLASAIAGLAGAEADARLAATGAKTNKNATAASLTAASAGALGSQDRITEAEARVTAAEANLSQAKAERERAARLVKSGSISQAELDRASTTADTAAAALAEARANLANIRSNALQATSRVQEASAKAEQARDISVVVAQAEARRDAARALVEQLKAARELAALDLSYTKIVAPADGTVSKKSIAVGQTLSSGTPVLQFLPKQGVWVIANFKETQIGRMRTGQAAKVSVDAFPGIELHGEVDSLSVATGSRFALLPPDNASGNFTKVVQRIPVKVRLSKLPEGIVLRPGMNVELAIDTEK